MPRANKVINITGARGKGKTSFLKDVVYPYKRVLVVDTFDNPVWRDWGSHHHPERAVEKIPIVEVEDLKSYSEPKARVFSSDTYDLMHCIEKYVYNCALVFEDAGKHMDFKLTKDQKRFVLDSKQKNLDIFFVFHGLSEVPKQLVKYSDYLTIFKTNEIWDSSLQRRYPNREVESAFKKVNNHKSQFFNMTVPIGS